MSTLKRIEVSDLSPESKDFIRKFSKMDQTTYDKVADKIESDKKPLTTTQVEYMMLK